MSSRRRPALAVIIGTLAAFLAGVVSPRAGVVVHSHSGGAHAHVHVGEVETEVAHQHHDDADDYRHGGHHHHAADDHHHAVAVHDYGEHGHSHRHDAVADHADHDHAHRATTATADGKPILVDADIRQSGSHWHAQHPYLRFLPSSITQHTLLGVLGQYQQLRPAARGGGSPTLPFARGPPC